MILVTNAPDRQSYTLSDMKFAAWYSILVGLLMLAQRLFFLLAGQVPELQAEPYRIAFHLVGEVK